MNEHLELDGAESGAQGLFPIFYVVFCIAFVHAAAPAQPLAAGRLHRFGLFVIKNGIFVIAYLYFFLRSIEGKFNIFVHRMIGPAAKFSDQFH